MKYLILSLSFCAMISLLSCGPSDTSQIEMSYGETQCADAWGTGSGSTLVEVQIAVKEYFDDQGIEVTDIDLVDNGPIITCAACDCSSNRVISLRVSEDHQSKMETEGFIKA